MSNSIAPVEAGTGVCVFQALGDENRLRIVEALRRGERCVCELQDDLGLGQSLLSHHLRTLREAGLVRARREGRWAHYSLAVGSLKRVETYVAQLCEDAETNAERAPRCSDG